jgi:hypothetical protein
VADADGGNVQQLTFDGHFHESPTVCDSGRAVVYSTDFDGANHLWKLDLHSGVSTKLTNGLGEWHPVCQGTGQWVMDTGQVPGGSTYVFKTSISGGAPVRFSDRAGGVASSGWPSPVHGIPGKNGTTVGVTVSTLTGAQEGVDTQLGDSSDRSKRIRVGPLGRPMSRVVAPVTFLHITAHRDRA